MNDEYSFPIPDDTFSWVDSKGKYALLRTIEAEPERGDELDWLKRLWNL